MSVPDPVLSDALSPQQMLVLALVAALGSLAVHMVVPALPAIAVHLRATSANAQLTIGIYLLGMAMGQLLAGPASDTFGRRTVLLVGVGFFVAGSVTSALAQSVPFLLSGRILQALGGAVGIVSARAIVSDLCGEEDVSGRVATLTSIALLSPLLAPSLGGILIELGGWRLIFVLLGAMAGYAGLFTLKHLQESLPPHARMDSIGAVFPAYRRLLQNARFCRFALANAASSAALYIFLTCSSFLLIDRWGLEPGEAGMFYFAVTAMGFMGTGCMRHLERGRGALRAGLAVMVGGGVVMLALALSGFSGPLALLFPMMIICGGSGIAAPASIAGAMHAEAGMVGTASSLAGAVQMFSSALASTVLSVWAASSFVAIATSILGMSLLAFCVAPAGRSMRSTTI